jgi:hypothetical protein
VDFGASAKTLSAAVSMSVYRSACSRRFLAADIMIHIDVIDIFGLPAEGLFGAARLTPSGSP